MGILLRIYSLIGRLYPLNEKLILSTNLIELILQHIMVICLSLNNVTQ